MEPLKEMFNAAYYRQLAQAFKKTQTNFDQDGFYKRVTKDLTDLSLNQRMRNTSVILKEFLPDDYEKSIQVLKKVIPNTKPGYTNLLFPDFVSVHGLQHFETSMAALKFFTSFGSSEFAVREFLKKDFKKALNYMIKWSRDKNHHVRRLSSEGSRPRLPWSFKLDAVIQDPSLTKPILENLKTDSELYVRKSVANHLNDITKENAPYMLALVKSWDQSHPHTAWIIKHGSRTLIKKGNADALSVFSYAKNPKVKIQEINLLTPKLKLGQKLQFEFQLLSQSSGDQKLVVDYIIHYRKKSGELSPKVFKLKDYNLKPKEKLNLKINQTFKDFTTRKHFKGEHLIAIQVNGKVIHKSAFQLLI